MTKVRRLTFFALLCASNVRAQSVGEPALLATESDRGTRLSVGGKLSSGTVRREYAGYVALSLPLDAYAAPLRLAQTAAEESTAPEGETEAPRPEPEPERPSAPATIALGTFLSLARQSVAQAVLNAGLARQRVTLDSLASRARASAALPELRLRAARSDDETLRLTPTSEDPYRYTLAGGSDLMLEATATWRLDRLLFADEEVAITRLRLERDKSEAAVVARTLARLFAWRRALARSASAELDHEAQLDAELDGWEAQAELDVLTNGWFSERLRILGIPAAAEGGAGDGQAGGNLLHPARDAGRNEKQSPGPPKAR